MDLQILVFNKAHIHMKYISEEGWNTVSVIYYLKFPRQMKMLMLVQLLVGLIQDCLQYV